MNLNVLGFFPWDQFLVSNNCDQRRCLIWFQFSWVCWGLFCDLPCGLSLRMFHVHLKRMYIFLVWHEMSCIYQLSPFVQSVVQCHNILLESFLRRSIHCWRWVVKILNYEYIAVDTFLEVLQDFPYIFGDSYVGCRHIYNVYVFLIDSSLEYYEVSFCVSFYGLCYEVYFVWYKYC